MPIIAGLIFAGGRGTRLGGAIKANIQIGGIPLVERVCTSLTGQTDFLLLSVGRFSQTEISCDHAMTAIPDPKDIDMGPVGGLVAAVEWCRGADREIDYLLSVAVDTPNFPTDFVTRANEVLTPEIDVVIGTQNGHMYPTNALWRLTALEGVPERVRGTDMRLGLKHLIPEARKAFIDYTHTSGAGSFDNINTKQDLASLTGDHDG